MFDTANARRLMVEGQIRTADVTDLDLLAAFQAVPRELFLPTWLAELAYVDKDLVVEKGRALLKPMVLAKLIQAAGVRPTDRVLDVACATGYSSAVLARVAGAVVALEENVALAGEAKEALTAAGAAHVEVEIGALIAGWPAGAPYDVILLNGAAEVLPEAYTRQLKPDGRLACVYGRPPATQAMIFRVIEGRLVGRPVFDASARLLPGFVAPPAFVF
jgi:protein-L-isoaspartate(D-aspartate) O-methyltransferase